MAVASLHFIIRYQIWSDHAVNFSKMLQPPHSSATLPQLQLLVQRCLLTAAPGSIQKSLWSVQFLHETSRQIVNLLTLTHCHSFWLRNYNAFVLLASQSVETCRNCLTLLDKIWPTSNSPDNPQVPLATRHVAHAKLVEPQHVVVAEVPRMQHCGCIVLSKRNWISTCSAKN